MTILEPLKLKHGEVVAIGRRRLIPVYVENTHSSLPLTLYDLQLNLSMLPSVATDDVSFIQYVDISGNNRDRYTAITLDVESLPITITATGPFFQPPVRSLTQALHIALHKLLKPRVPLLSSPHLNPLSLRRAACRVCIPGTGRSHGAI